MFLIKAFAALLLSIILNSWAFAVEEDKVFKAMTDLMNSANNCASAPRTAWETRIVHTPQLTWPNLSPRSEFKTYKLRYSRFGCEIGEKGALVVSPGRTESSIEFYETAIDFIAQGYSPVLPFDLA